MGSAVGPVVEVDVGLAAWMAGGLDMVSAAVSIRLEITSASFVQYVLCFSLLSNSVMITAMSR
jgi:hypothetical protein